MTNPATSDRAASDTGQPLDYFLSDLRIAIASARTVLTTLNLAEAIDAADCILHSAAVRLDQDIAPKIATEGTGTADPDTDQTVRLDRARFDGAVRLLANTCIALEQSDEPERADLEALDVVLDALRAAARPATP